MPYRRTENVTRRLAARHAGILAAARAAASEGGMAAVQIVPVAQRAGIAAGTVYRYFPAKIDLVAALLAEISKREIGALRHAAAAAPGPLSALAASIMTFAARALRDRRLAFAAIAEPVDADLVLSLHVDAIDSPRGNGVAAYYFGTAQSSSWIGERLADLAQREIVARTGLLSVRTHAKTWSLLRLTRMPAVRLELGYLSSPSDRERLLDAGFRDTVAEALLIAVQRLYLPTESDQPTGVMQISAVG